MTNSITVHKKIVPLSLQDAPSLIESILPAQKISAEAQRERTAGPAQTLTALGSYWKGRKPLVLNKAAILGVLLPATGNPERDLSIFEKLMAMDDAALALRMKSKTSAANFETLSYLERVKICSRPEEIESTILYQSIWGDVNLHLGTDASNFPELIEQLGVMRFGHRPKVADSFSGSGQIPFEAARLGCDVYAADLNPIACMLTWGAINLVGAPKKEFELFEKVQKEVLQAVENEITELAIEHDSNGRRAKSYIYCLEVVCPQTGWKVPVLPSFVVSAGYKVRGYLVPDPVHKRFDIRISAATSDEDMQKAKIGTLQDGYVVYELEGEVYRTSIKSLRGDYKQADGTQGNRLRRWDNADIEPRSADVFQERLFCVQWYSQKGARSSSEFLAPSAEDLRQERRIVEIVSANLRDWQNSGFLPDMEIEPGDETTRLGRERGWTYWHQLFSPRQLLMLATFKKHISQLAPEESAAMCLRFANALNYMSKLTPWATSAARPTGGPSDNFANTFYNQALNTQYLFGTRSWYGLQSILTTPFKNYPVSGTVEIETNAASVLSESVDIAITDPPYADAVVYHEITEFFIAWLRRNPPGPFASWIWDSRRALAIKGSGDEFRRDMSIAYKTMADKMSANGLQVVMFTHQDGAVWADMASIMWGAGLQVTAAWYIATETTSELKKGCFVQGTVLLVLRKRTGTAAAYRDELVQEVKEEVVRQMDTLIGLNQTSKGNGRTENLFEDADLQMAGYAAALRVLTGYTHIDGRDMTAEAMRPRGKGERGVVGEIIDFAVQVANEHLVPEGLPAATWDSLSGSERFYLKMLDTEAAGLKKLDNYQNFAKAFRVSDYTSLMSSAKANDSRLKTGLEFKKTLFDGEFGQSRLRAILFALYELQKEVDSDEAMAHLRDMIAAYHTHRDSLIALARYIADKRSKTNEKEAEAARILLTCIQNERLGG